jgi:hypothetical protein
LSGYLAAWPSHLIFIFGKEGKEGKEGREGKRKGGVSPLLEFGDVKLEMT